MRPPSSQVAPSLRPPSSVQPASSQRGASPAPSQMALQADAWRQPQLDPELFPMRLPYASELKREPKKKPKGCGRIKHLCKKLDPCKWVRWCLEEVVEFFFFWFGSMRFEHSIADDFIDRLQELGEAYQSTNDEKRKDKLKNKLREVHEKTERVKGATKKSLKDPTKKQKSSHFGKVKRPKRNKSAIHPDAPRAKPILEVTVIGASNLRRSDWDISSGYKAPDPYFTCELVGRGKKHAQHYNGIEDVVNNTTDPIFNVTFKFVDYVIGDALVFKIWDQDIGGDDLLGTARLEPLEFFPAGFDQSAVQLQTSDKEDDVKITVRVSVLFPKARGWGGQPPGMRDKPQGWQAGEYVEDQEDEGIVKQSPPVFIILQCIAALLVWIMGLGGEVLPMSGLESFAPGQTSLVYQRDCEHDHRFNVWRWFSYQFTHVGFNHIFYNMLMLVLMGIALEGLNGTLHTFAMFNIGVFGGACCWMVSDAHTETVGMSGGCYSLIGIMLGDLVMNWRETPKPITSLMAIFIIVAVDFIQAAMAHAENVSNSAHVGGAVAGFLASVLIGRNIKVSRAERILKVVSCFVGVALIAACAFWALPHPVPNTIFDQVRFCWHRQVISPGLFGDTSPHCVRCADKACINAWGSHVVSCGADCVMGTVSLGDCASKYGGWSALTPSPPTTTTPIPGLVRAAVTTSAAR